MGTRWTIRRSMSGNGYMLLYDGELVASADMPLDLVLLTCDIMEVQAS